MPASPPARFFPVVLLGFLGIGCGQSYLPPATGVPSVSASAGQYAVRRDLMVVGKTGLDGAPKHWSASGFPPLRSARLPNATPDRDLADDLRKQFGKIVLDPATDLSPVQTATFARLLESDFGIPAEPRVRVPDWEEFARAAIVRPDPSKGVFGNLGATAPALGKWGATRWKTEWTAATPAKKEQMLGAVAPPASGVFGKLGSIAGAPSNVAGQRRWGIQRWKTDWTEANAWKQELKLDDVALARGSVTYRRWCLQCHGPTGAGDSAHAIESGPMPRDYRQGIFKYVTAFPAPGQSKRGLGPSGKPRRDDLKRTVRNGIDGTMMPAFTSLSEPELDDLIGYVIHLSIRGETEFATMARAMQPGEDDPDLVGPELEWLFDQNLLSVLYNWGVAARSPIPIPPENTRTEDERVLSAIRGYKLYNSAEFGCAACHINYGREPALKWDLWGTVVQPRNLTLGVYRGGRRGEDLYARVYGGIYPSGMTGFYTTLATGPSYPDRPNKIWNVVHFLQALADPHERQRIQDPVLLARYKERLRADGDLTLDDLNGVKIDP